LDVPLTPASAGLAEGSQAICVFVNDDVGAEVLDKLAALKIRLVALRCTGFNNVDLAAARRAGIKIARVPDYSPHAVAEHTIALMLGLNRKLHRAFNRVREGNFSLDGLLGFDLKGKTVGIVGTGNIGEKVARILHGFGCDLLATDPLPSATCKAIGVRYVSWPELCSASRIISLHCPLTPQTHHLVDEQAIDSMQPGVMLVNTSRGAVVDTRAIIKGLKSGAIGSLALDVYEEEAHLFFEDLSSRIINDDVFARLLTFPNVLITGHQAFFTHEALTAIAATTLANLNAFAAEGAPLHEVSVEKLAV
jgi:D-lactate dehydrogenase